MKAFGERSQKHGPSGKRGRSMAQKFAQSKARAADIKDRDATLYGDVLADVRYLRTRGFVITKADDGIRIGTRITDADGVREVAARQRRLAVPA